MEHFCSSITHYTSVHKIFLIFHSNSSWFTNIEYRILVMWSPLINWNNLTTILIIFVAKIDANKKFFFLTLDFDDFFSPFSNQKLKNKKMKFEIKINFTFKFQKLKGPNSYNLENMRITNCFHLSISSSPDKLAYNIVQ